MMTRCEVKKGGVWTPIDTNAAYALPSVAVMRCIWCHGAVHLYPAKKGSGASVPHFGHNEANPGCPHKMHPKAIE